jgi:hypothetical protein
MQIRFVAISMPVILAAALPPGAAFAQLQLGAAQTYQLYPRANASAPLQHGLAKPVESNLRERLERIQCAGSALCAWRRIPSAGEQFWRGGSRSRRDSR